MHLNSRKVLKIIHSIDDALDSYASFIEGRYSGLPFVGTSNGGSRSNSFPMGQKRLSSARIRRKQKEQKCKGW